MRTDRSGGLERAAARALPSAEASKACEVAVRVAAWLLDLGHMAQDVTTQYVSLILLKAGRA